MGGVQFPGRGSFVLRYQIIQRFAKTPQRDGVDNCLQSFAESFLHEDTEIS